MKLTSWFLMPFAFVVLSTLQSSSAAGQALAVDDLTLEQKVGQMVFPRLPGILLSNEDPRLREVLALAGEGKIGGVVLFGGDPLSAQATAERLQAASPIPLLIGLDAEWGIGMRLEGGMRFPVAMAVGAANDLELAEEIGRWTAREALELGIHLILAPVLDLAVEPDNRVIGIRSFGSDPERVAALGAAFVRGVQNEGALAVAKHFPGHGATVEDSHFGLPRLTVDLEVLRRRELVPFRASIEAGIAGVMPAHLVVAALQEDETPASRSKEVLGGLLRRDLGFDGLIISDALDMAGARGEWHGSVILDAVAAGTDILLLPPQPRVAVHALTRAVNLGVVSMGRLDASVERILDAKRKVGLLAGGVSTRRARKRGVGTTVPLTEDRSAARGVAVRTARAAVTWIDDRVDSSGGRGLDVAVSDVSPPGQCFGSTGPSGLGPCWHGKVLVVTLLDEFDRRANPRTVAAAVARRARSVSDFWVTPSSAADRVSEVDKAIAEADAVLFASYASRKSWGPLAAQDSSWTLVQGWIEAAHKRGIPAVLADFDDPWVLALEAPARLGIFDGSPYAQTAIVQAIYGEIPIAGTLPVEIGSSKHPHGAGAASRLVARAWSLPSWTGEPVSDSQTVGMHPKVSLRLRKVLQRAAKKKVFPGAVGLVARHGKVVFHEAVGNLSYDRVAEPVDRATVYDLASLTKVVVTTTLAMMMEERSLLDLEAPVQRYLPEFRGEGKEAVLVIDLLTHASGMLWWTDLYQRHGLRGTPNEASYAGYLKEVFEMPLNSTPRSSTEYSDLGLLLMGEILERVSGRRLDELARTEIFEPLSMNTTGYRPTAPPLFLPVRRIAPTELDQDWRGVMVRGEVHDENAAGLGGVAPHAGVFSIAADLGRFLQMLSNGGHLDGYRLLKRSTIERYIRRAERVAGSSRAIGWDTPSGMSSAGDYFAAASFGHTGFTGTSLWVDLEHGVWAVLLTNRVHPTRDNREISGLRRKFHDTLMLAIEDEVVEKRVE